jgi:D-alanyl-D-alanine dipeptidase
MTKNGKITKKVFVDNVFAFFLFLRQIKIRFKYMRISKLFVISLILLTLCASCKKRTAQTDNTVYDTLLVVTTTGNFDSVVAQAGEGADFVMLTDVVPDAILEIRYFSTYNFVGRRIDGYLEPTALLTRRAADSLKAVSDDLMRQGYRLKIYDAYRPTTAVEHFVRWSRNPDDTLMKAYFYPMMRKSELFPKGYISSHSGHSRGSTVDLTLFDMRTEKEADMGSTFDWLGVESHPDYGGNPATGQWANDGRLTEEQFRNRMTLRTAMMRHGFKPVGTEWWHFTLRNEPYPTTYFSFPVRRIGK